jgi:hypothetical protein
MAVLIAAAVAILVAFMTRALKISEFRQAWINGLRDEISEYTSKADEWIEMYIDFNSEPDQEVKAEVHPKLNSVKYDAFRMLRKIEMRFKPEDLKANVLLSSLHNLLDPAKLSGSSRYSSWRTQADEAILQARYLLKEEWEATKNPLRRTWEKLAKKLSTRRDR